MSPVFWMPAVWTAVAGVVLLALLVVVVLRPVRRFTRAREALRRGLAPRAAALQAIAAALPRHRGQARASRTGPERGAAPRPGTVRARA